MEAIASLEAGRSVVVCAPTGSGKTVVGEYAIHAALAGGSRVFYTTPLKALSNQKFRDFGAQFGEERVGLLTGDISINRDAPVVVMTTEVFRNMLYAGSHRNRTIDMESGGSGGGASGARRSVRRRDPSSVECGAFLRREPGREP